MESIVMHDESLAGTPAEVDRTGWPKGPWDNEPDRLDWKTKAGFPAIALRHSSGHWCGYVGVPNGHPAYGNGDEAIVDVHGGVTYASKCAGRVCHVPVPGEPADVFWLGFYFAHSGDAAPSKWNLNEGWSWWSNDGRTLYWGPKTTSRGGEVRGLYRDLQYVKRECERVGLQLAEMAKP
jgi:hypothetical protein